MRNIVACGRQRLRGSRESLPGARQGGWSAFLAGTQATMPGAIKWLPEQKHLTEINFRGRFRS
jgi:hypothetical protein